MTAEKVLGLNGDFRSSPLLDTARRLHACFSRRGIAYAIIGGLAVVRNGAVRTTVDVDVLLSRQDRQKARKALGGDFTTAPDGARDLRNQVQVDFLYSGDEWGMIVPVPSPGEHSEFDRKLGANFMDLRGLLELKTAVYLHKKREDGIELAAKCLADVVALVQANPNAVGPSLLASLHPLIPQGASAHPAQGWGRAVARGRPSARKPGAAGSRPEPVVPSRASTYTQCMKPVRWGVLGIGKHFVQRVLPSLLASPLVEVAAVASRDLARARAVAGRFGIPSACGSYEELLADRGLEAVYIALPNHLHLEWVRRAAQAGKHVLCEKPLALNAGQARECLERCRAGGVRLMEAFMYRFHPQWRRALELVRHGEIGTVRSVHTGFGFFNADPRNIRNVPDYGGGALLDIGCYAVSVPRFLFQAEPRRVVSLVARDPELKVDVLSSAILDFGEGRATFSVGTQLFSHQGVEVVGGGGRIAVEVPFNMYPDSPARLTVTTGIGSREPALPPADQYGLEFEAFSRALREDRPVPTPPEDAVANMAVLDALLASERSGGWEKV